MEQININKMKCFLQKSGDSVSITSYMKVGPTIVNYYITVKNRKYFSVVPAEKICQLFN